MFFYGHIYTKFQVRKYMYVVIWNFFKDQIIYPLYQITNDVMLVRMICNVDDQNMGKHPNKFGMYM